MNNPPAGMQGMRHIALFVTQLEVCADFYTRLLGMTVAWQPDPNNIYLSSGSDNLALHRAPPDFLPGKNQHLDHFGFFLAKRGDVDHWHDWLLSQDVPILAKPRDHRDGTRSFYCADPDRNSVQFIYVPQVTPDSSNK